MLDGAQKKNLRRRRKRTKIEVAQSIAELFRPTYAGIVDGRQPVRINPSVASQGGQITTFRDGPRLVPDYLAEFVTADEYPDLTFQGWVDKVANKQMESRVVGQALGLMRTAHFGR